MQSVSLSRRFRPGKLLSLVLALVLALALIPGQALAADREESSGYAYEIALPAEDQDAPGYNDTLLYLLTGQHYYLLLDGEVLLTAETPEELTELVRSTAESYVTEDTISCALADPEQLHLCYGYLPLGANEDPEAAAETLAQQLQVVTVNRTVREETVPYTSVQQEDEERYTDEEPVVTPGTDGLNQVTEDTTCLNGQAQDTTVVHVEVLEEPVDEVTVVGVKKRPEYIWPASGRISSKFGPRNIAVGSKNHKGIDIAVSYGSDIVAAKAGTVIYAQWNDSGYGYLVKIEHENGDVTYYAHNSSLVVEKGDTVEQGDVIAKAGSTGRSSGTHCHFEIRVDGTPVNPLDYLES